MEKQSKNTLENLVAKEILEQRLGVVATEENVKLLASYLDRFEKKVAAKAKKCQSQHKQKAVNNLLRLNIKEATTC